MIPAVTMNSREVMRDLKGGDRHKRHFSLLHILSKEVSIMKKTCTTMILSMVIFLCVLSMAVSSMANDKKVYFASWGGMMQTMFEDELAPYFQEETGYEAVFIPIATSMEMVARVMAEKNSPRIDVVMLDAGPSAHARAQGLFERLDPAIVTSLQDMYEIAQVPKGEGVLNLVAGSGILYDTEVFEKQNWPAPTSWHDLFRPEFKKKLVIPPPGNTFGLVALLQLAELGEGNERNIEPGFELMKKLAPSVLVWEASYPAFMQLFQGKSAAIGVWDTPTTYMLAKSGAPIKFVYPKEGTWACPTALNVVKNGPNPIGAQKLINFMIQERAQMAYVNALGYAPLNKKVQLPEDIAKRVPSPAVIEQMKVIDWEYVNQLRPNWIERWNKEVGVIK